MHRLIVLSAVYRQSSDMSDQSDAAAKDADVRYLWRFPSHRLEAESIRDSMLAVSGQLNVKMHGRGFNLFDQRGGLSGFDPIETFTPDNQRRMIYAHKVRREPETVFGAFDCPDAGQSTAIRRASTTPIQALNLFNSLFTLAQTDAFAARVKKEAGDDLLTQIKRAYQLALSREPTGEELEESQPIVHQHGIATLCRALFNSNEFLCRSCIRHWPDRMSGSRLSLHGNRLIGTTLPARRPAWSRSIQDAARRLHRGRAAGL
jgi:hypothetical protein